MLTAAPLRGQVGVGADGTPLKLWCDTLFVDFLLPQCLSTLRFVDFPVPECLSSTFGRLYTACRYRTWGNPNGIAVLFVHGGPVRRFAIQRQPTSTNASQPTPLYRRRISIRSARSS